MTLTFGTICDIDRSRQRIIDCKLKNRWPRRSENFAYTETRPPFVFAAVKRIHAYLTSAPEKTFARLIKGGTLFPPQSPSRKRVTRNLRVPPSREGGQKVCASAKGRGGSMQIYAEPPASLSTAQTTIRSSAGY